ncbi:MAG: hypothetical protein KatS3mg068_0839 [Candidatus Sericytochromatia bacterium]|nr:MAG: hypothetical protein KatS3mg068_0839 [Candidatus Sericytochromatia bacterium]
MAKEITNESGLITLIETEDLSAELCNKDIAPTSFEQRHWNIWNITAVWVGMAVCIPTYMLASYMITDGLTWKEALFIIFLGNFIVAFPMVFNGHAGTKYGISFPVLGRAAFGIKGVHIPSILRALVACGWFGVQTWLGGLAIHSIFQQIFSISDNFLSKFFCFMIFWFINIYFIWKGNESIKFLESLSAPLLILIGLLLLYWGINQGGGINNVLSQSDRLNIPTVKAIIKSDNKTEVTFNLLLDKEGNRKANQFKINQEEWQKIPSNNLVLLEGFNLGQELTFTFRNEDKLYQSSTLKVIVQDEESSKDTLYKKLKKYLLWLTSMVGFWATLALNIPDLTRFAKGQKEQFIGQFLGLPTTMVLYSFIGIAVTCTAILIFPDILIKEDAPWDPVNLISKLDNPVIIIFAQLTLLLATLSTNIVANVIAPANSFTNAFPKYISFRLGGVIAGIIGILICPWLLINEISGFLLNYSAVLGPLVAIMLADYYSVRNKQLSLIDLYSNKGQYYYSNGFNNKALIAFGIGVISTYIYKIFPTLEILHLSSWFTGFIISYITYLLLMKK